ncbi:hypothetical protein JG687_00016185, partial [Phytophthora cactorum]
RHREGDEAFTPGDKVGAYEEDASEADTQNVKPGTLSCLRLQASTLLTKHVHGICCMADIQSGKEKSWKKGWRNEQDVGYVHHIPYLLPWFPYAKIAVWSKVAVWLPYDKAAVWLLYSFDVVLRLP